jgi:hypothetical protein
MSNKTDSKKARKLVLSRVAIRELSSKQLLQAAGGSAITCAGTVCCATAHNHNQNLL